MSALGFKVTMDPLLAYFLTCVILRFTSGATPADCIEVSMAGRPFQYIYLQIPCGEGLNPWPYMLYHSAVYHSATWAWKSILLSNDHVYYLLMMRRKRKATKLTNQNCLKCNFILPYWFNRTNSTYAIKITFIYSSRKVNLQWYLTNVCFSHWSAHSPTIYSYGFYYKYTSETSLQSIILANERDLLKSDLMKFFFLYNHTFKLRTTLICPLWKYVTVSQ